MCHVFFRFMSMFVLFLHERGWQIRDLEVWGLMSHYVSNVDKFSYTYIQWGRFLTCIANLHYFQAEMTTAMQVDDLDENGNLISTAMVPRVVHSAHRKLQKNRNVVHAYNFKIVPLNASFAPTR